jgi:putative lipase involved disintegration of autophagic bodies
MWPECNCSVHTGFQMAAEIVQDDVLAEVKRLQQMYPAYDVKSTGHSLGSALTHLTTMMLLKNDVKIA